MKSGGDPLLDWWEHYSHWDEKIVARYSVLCSHSARTDLKSTEIPYYATVCQWFCMWTVICRIHSVREFFCYETHEMKETNGILHLEADITSTFLSLLKITNCWQRRVFNTKVFLYMTCFTSWNSFTTELLLQICIKGS